jgi:hypothetical protein
VGNSPIDLVDVIGYAAISFGNRITSTTSLPNSTLSVVPAYPRLANGFDGFAGKLSDGEFGYAFKMQYYGKKKSIILARLEFFLSYETMDGEIHTDHQSYYEWFSLREIGGTWGVDTQSINISNVCRGRLAAYIDYGYTTSFETDDPFGPANLGMWTLDGDFFGSWAIRTNFEKYDKQKKYHDDVSWDMPLETKTWSFQYHFDRQEKIDEVSIEN